MNKKVPYKILLLIIILVITSAIALKDLFKKGMFTSHDGIHQVARLYHFDKSLSEGQFPVRYAGEALNGFGYPLFIFNYQTPWYIGETIYKLTGSLTLSVKLTFLLTYILSGIIMFLWQRKYWGNLGGFIAALLYLWAPYRFSVIFVRGALGDATCFVFFPLILWAIDNLVETKPFYWVAIGSLSLALLLLSHAMIFFLFLPIPIFYFLIKLFTSVKKANLIKKGLLMFLIGGALSIFYWLPATIEKKQTVFKDIMNVHFQDHFPTLKQLFYSKWGYGFSFAGTEKDEMSFQVGIVQWLIITLSIVLITFLLFKYRKNLKKVSLWIIFFILVFSYSIFMMLPISFSVWSFFSRFFSLDFPFRMLFLTTFSASILAGFLIVSSGRFRWLVALFLIILAFYGNRNHLRINDSLYWSDSFYAQIERTTNTYDEYRPLWVDSNMVSKRPKKIIEIERTSRVTELEQKSSWLKFNLSAKKESPVIINKVYYPGWYVKVNNQVIKFDYKNKGGLINFVVKPGKYSIEAGFAETNQRLLVNFISGFTLIICLFLFCERNTTYRSKEI